MWLSRGGGRGFVLDYLVQCGEMVWFLEGEVLLYI